MKNCYLIILHPAFFGDVSVQLEQQLRQLPITINWNPEKQNIIKFFQKNYF